MDGIPRIKTCERSKKNKKKKTLEKERKEDREIPREKSRVMYTDTRKVNEREKKWKTIQKNSGGRTEEKEKKK